MSYTIGQILYVVLNKKSQVYPMQIIEVITKKTLQGEDVKYLLRAGSDKSSTVMLDQIDGELFDSADVARSVLIKRATTQVNRLIDMAVKKSQEWYGSLEDTPQTIQDLPDLSEDIQHTTSINSKSKETAEVMLPDGTVAKIKMPAI